MNGSPAPARRPDVGVKPVGGVGSEVTPFEKMVPTDSEETTSPSRSKTSALSEWLPSTKDADLAVFSGDPLEEDPARACLPLPHRHPGGAVPDRFGHRVRWFWASHVNHHSSQHYNLSTALRQTWTGFLTLGFILLVFGWWQERKAGSARVRQWPHGVATPSREEAA